MKAYFESTERNYAFRIGKRIQKCAMDCGLDYSKAEGLFSKSAGTTGSILENLRALLRNGRPNQYQPI